MWGYKNVSESKGYMFDNIGDFAFSKIDNKIIFGIYDSKYIPQNADAFFDSSTTRQFKLVNEDNDLKTCIIVNGEYCPAFEDVNHLDLLKLHNLTLFQIMTSFYPAVIDQRWEDLADEYKALRKFEYDLVDSVGGAYDGMFYCELEEFRDKAFDVAKDYAESLNDLINKGFFSYDDSTVRDLSIFNDERMFYWSYDFCETPSGVVMSSLGEFWIDV